MRENRSKAFMSEATVEVATQKVSQQEELHTLPWSTDFPRSGKREQSWAMHEFPIPAELTEGLSRRAVREGVSWADVWLAAFSVFVTRYLGVEGFVLGVWNNGQTAPEAFLMNLSIAPKFGQLLQQIQDREPVEAAPPQTLLAFGIGREPLEAWGCELSFNLVEGHTGWKGQLLYRSDLFAANTMSRMARNLLVLLAGIIESSDVPISRLPILHSDEWELLHRFHGETRAFPTDRCFPELFLEQVAQSPDAPAVQQKGKAITYRELNERANLLGLRLQELGISPNTFVGYFGERNLDWVVSILAIWKAGGVYVPLDPNYPADRLAYMMEDTGMKVILTFESLVQQLPRTDAKLFLLDKEWSTLGTHPEENVTSELIPHDVAYVIYTSGSTGRPKGAMVEHRGMINHLYSKVEGLQISSDDLIAQNSSQCVDISIWQLFAGLLVGGCVHILPDDVAFDPYRQIEVMESLQLTIVETVPTLLRSMLDEIGNFPQKPRLSALRWMIPNGEALPPELCRRWLTEYPDSPLINAYGPTECSDDVTHFFIYEPPAEHVVTTLIGSALPNVQLYVLDQHLQPVPIGVMGELYVGGLVVGRGYLNNSEKTAAAFLNDLFSAEEGARLYRTGDYARYLEDGNLDFMGRVDHQVKVNGMRIELGEIEAALTDHADIEHVIVVDRLDDKGNKRLVAYMICVEERNPSAPILREFVNKTLPKHMIPSAFVQLNEFPLTLNGKIDRKRLPEPSFEELPDATDHVTPATDEEIKMTRIWSEVLGVERVGLQDRFFDLGGHSLQAIQILSLIRREFEKEVSLRDLFERSTPGRLLAALQKGNGEGAPALVPMLRDGPLPTSFAQQRLWNIEKAFPMPFLYNIPITFRFKGPLQPEALRLAMQELICRHESLRTVFTEVDGVPYQVVLPELDCPWRTENLSMLDDSVQPQQVRERELQEGGQVFDLYNGPLLSNLLLRLDEEEHALILTMHHNISDGWSVRVIMQELADLYPHFAHGTERRRPALSLHYVDYAKWHRDWLEEEGMTAQLAYWTTQLSGELPVLPLPVDRQRTEQPSFLGKTLSARLPESLVQQLAVLSQESGCTMFMTMLAAYQVLLYHYSGHEDILVGVPSTNRNQPELEAMIGLIVNLLPIRTDLSGKPTFRELLKRVQEVSLGAFANQDYPLEKLFETLQPERKKSGVRLYQTTFAYENNQTDGKELAPGLTWDIREIRSEMARGNLILSVVEEDTGMEIMFEYSSDLFDDETIRQMLDRLYRLLESLAAEPEQSIDKLSLM